MQNACPAGPSEQQLGARTSLRRRAWEHRRACEHRRSCGGCKCSPGGCKSFSSRFAAYRCSQYMLDCMPELDQITDSYHTFKDQRAWRENTPAKIGVYHCFMRTTAQNMCEHKIFIVVSGYCKHASEELHNMWLDVCHDITAGQFLVCRTGLVVESNSASPQ